MVDRVLGAEIEGRGAVTDSQRGYSLVEALISVAILGGIAAALAPATYAAVRASTRVAASTNAAEAERASDEALAQLFARMMSPGSSSSNEAFVGAPQRVAFHILTDGERGPRRVELKIADDRLVFLDEIDRAAIAGNGEGARAAPAVLIEGVRRFRFYGATDADREASWSDRWRESEAPLLVAIERTTPPGREGAQSRAYFLSSRAALSCAFDQVSRQCRR